MLAKDVVAYITNAEARWTRSRDVYLGRTEAMDLPSARFSVELTQPPVNFAAHLLRIAGGRITEWRMVDASQLRAPGG